MKTAKPMVDTKAPEKRNHVIAKWKKKQVHNECIHLKLFWLTRHGEGGAGNVYQLTFLVPIGK